MTKMTFEAWMKEVDKAVQGKAGCSVHDLADCRLANWHANGVTPKNAASRAIRNDMEE